jgi:hypothetical protein
MSIKAAKLLRVYVTFGTVVGTAPARSWNVTLVVTPQPHSDPNNGHGMYYDGRDVKVGDWLATSNGGNCLRIKTIGSQNSTTVVAVVEDAHEAMNAVLDPNQGGDSAIPSGEGVVFEEVNGMPVIFPLPEALPGVFTPTFAQQLINRFFTANGGFGGKAAAVAIDAIPGLVATTVQAALVEVASAAGAAPTWTSVTGKPTTISGYGINDALALGSVAGTAAGTAAAGTATTAARSDHVHPAQTSVSGNAATATKLQTARTIAGVSFDGSANIAIPYANLTGLPTAYSHPAGDGNLHVPATGTTNNKKVLKAGATAGTISWGDVDWADIANKPADVMLAYKFTVQFTNMDPTSIIGSLPAGWSATFSGSYVTITHTVGRAPAMVSYMGYNTGSGTATWRFRFPTAANELTILDSASTTKFTFALTTSVAAADLGGKAIINVFF